MKRFEQSNGLDTALYKNYLYLYLTHLFCCVMCVAVMLLTVNFFDKFFPIFMGFFTGTVEPRCVYVNCCVHVITVLFMLCLCCRPPYTSTVPPFNRTQMSSSRRRTNTTTPSTLVSRATCSGNSLSPSYALSHPFLLTPHCHKHNHPLDSSLTCHMLR